MTRLLGVLFRPSLLVAAAVLTAAPAITVNVAGMPVAAAWADDDGGGDDGDDGGGGGHSGGGGEWSGSLGFRPQATPGQPRRTGPRATQRAAPAEFAPAELVVSDLQQQDLEILLAEGFTLLERRPITALGATIDRLRVPAGVPLPAARDRVRSLPSGTDADFNHFYRAGQAQPASAPPPCTHGNCPAWEAIGWPAAGIAAGRCTAGSPIGLIDTGINPAHETLDGSDLTILQRPAQTASGSRAIHGTAVASLLVGNPASRVPGLVPAATVLAVDVFTPVPGDERADVAALVEGLDLLAARQVRLYNLSLAGPANSVLARMLDRLTDPEGLDAVAVAAAGNGGPAAGAAWPAAHPAVIAVTAIDPRGRPFRQAQRGPHIALAAPGVGLLAATSVRGARGKSGTSFAVPFVTAAAALVLSRQPSVAASEVRATLNALARDLGAPGRDDIFGYGLLWVAPLCP